MRTAINPPELQLIAGAEGGSYDVTECVKDDVTDLIWEGKTASGLCAGDKTYSNFDSARRANHRGSIFTRSSAHTPRLARSSAAWGSAYAA